MLGFDSMTWYTGLGVDEHGNVTHYQRNMATNKLELITKETTVSEGDINYEYVDATPLPAVKWLSNSHARPTPAGNSAVFDYEVKSWPWFFEPMCALKKKHDMRDKRDRDYKVGDRMLLREWDPRTGAYTGREAVAYITYITSNDAPCAMSSNALDRNACILSVDVTELGDTDRFA